MKRVVIATCVALACAVSLAAQTPASQDKPAAGQPAAADKGVTLKGCLRAGDSPDTFVLANAMPASGATGTTGAAAGAATTAKTVRLTGAPAGMNLKDHVGHTVEITGMMTGQGAKSATPPPSDKPAGAPGASSSAASAAQTLNVKSMKHVEAKCGE